MSVAKQLQSIYNDNGTITPQLVVNSARDDNHPLHNHFEWDDSTAGELYRCSQAGQMIRRVTITRMTQSGKNVVTRAWVSRTEIEGRTANDKPIGQYIPVEVVTESANLRPKYEQAMEREWRTLYAKYKDYQAFIDMVSADVSAVA